MPENIPEAFSKEYILGDEFLQCESFGIMQAYKILNYAKLPDKVQEYVK